MDKSTEFLNTLSLIAEDVDASQTSSRARLAAALVYRNKIIAIGTNQKKSHPFQKKYGKNEDAIFLHAETNTILGALRYLTLKQISKSTLYICRIKHEDGPGSPIIWGLSKPCIGCQRAIATFDIRNVIYSEEGDSYSFL